MKSKLTIFEKKLEETLNRILSSTKALGRHILSDLKGKPLWVDDNKEGFILEPDKVIYALLHIKHDRHLSARETYACPGAVASTSTTLKLIEMINADKDEFKAIIQQIHQLLGQRPGKWVQDVLAKAGHGVVKLKHVYRHIPCVHYHPHRIAWSKGRNGTSKKISLAEAKERLVEFGEKEAINVQLSKLSLLRESDKLVVFHAIRPHFIVNISRLDEQQYTLYEKLTTSLPLFYLHDDNLPPPRVEYAIERPRRQNPRADKLIADEPYLQSICAYMYR